MVFNGYWGHPEATAAAFIELDGKRFFRTGDLGRMDEEGYFFITDRLKRMINASGFKVWPCGGRAAAVQVPAGAGGLHHRRARRLPRRDRQGGGRAAPGSPRPTATEDIVAWAREHMAAYKVPRIVEFVDALPKSGSGKVMWRALQEQENAERA